MMYKQINDEIKLFLVHPGGPYFKNKDLGYWSIPKGLPEKEDEDLLEAAKREFEEETGIKPEDEFLSLGSVKQKSGKIVYAWAFQKNINEDNIDVKSNLFELEWPPKSGKYINIPEIDRGEYFSVTEAKKKINSAQIEFIDRLLKNLNK